MGIRILSDMRDELTLRLGNRTDLPTARLHAWINAAYMEIATRYVFHELHAIDSQILLANDDTLVLPTDIHSIFSVRDMTNQVKLRPTFWRVLDNQEVTFGEPEAYTRFGSSMIVWPGTNADVTIQTRYLKRVMPLAVDSDAAVTPAEWDEVIEQGALWRGLRAILEPDRANDERQEHLRLINSMPLFDQLEDIDAGLENTIGVRFR